MAWNTGNSYPSGTPLTAALIIGIGNDFRTWGGNVDGGGYSLSNLAGLFTAGSVGIGTPSTATKLSVVSTASIDGLTLSSLNRASIWLTTTGGSNRNWLIQNAVASGTDLQFIASPTVGSTPSVSIMTLLATGAMGVGTALPTAPLQVVGTPTYASDAAAGTGGLTAGAVYKHSDGSLWTKL